MVPLPPPGSAGHCEQEKEAVHPLAVTEELEENSKVRQPVEERMGAGIELPVNVTNPSSAAGICLIQSVRVAISAAIRARMEAKDAR